MSAALLTPCAFLGADSNIKTEVGTLGVNSSVETWLIQKGLEAKGDGGATFKFDAEVSSDRTTSDEGELSYSDQDDNTDSETSDNEDVKDWEWQSVESASSVDESECPSNGSIDDVVDFHAPEETIIIFDWDDTICPTTVLTGETAYFDIPEGSEEMKTLISEAKKAIEKARTLADEVIIVTNATEGWVEGSAQAWLPELTPVLEGVQIVSARSVWEPTGIPTPTGWKSAAFEDCIRKFYSKHWRQAWKNIIVIGDSCYEHEALEQVAELAPRGFGKECRAKSVKFQLHPSIGMLANQLHMLTEGFEGIVQCDDCLDFQLYTESL